MAVTGAIFLALVTLAVFMTLSGGSGGSGSDGSKGQGQTAPAERNTTGGDAKSTAKKLVSGVPVGYSHNQGGAVQAAVNYQVARSSAAYFTDEKARHATLTAMMASQARERQIRNDDIGMQQVLTSLGVTASNEGELVARTAAMGTRVITYTDQVATVEVWMAGLVGVTDRNAPMPVSASWTTYTLTLQWQSGDWKLASITSVNGPTPLDTGSDSPSSVDEFRTADREFNAPPYAG
ncbi:hypothetical protein PV387_10445 [Streptomyces sp. ME02-6987-2C]|uniref:hypothetical protein n=1 Tax=unclassified Streptomyces TaxID=2593676 RepID=UPI0008794C59|nr:MULTISPECIES: hypothetical protein [unclassified Streptomyces]MDX3366446.1 hypothetical protein [Streptomyces sp. ME02-6987-2C]MDX3423731.1 hypothetical protein [Streptomyces sp. ME02-6985-2c]REH20629.1 hypothetical protein BX268_2413 [Streptomyces sp. 2221.1]SDT30683.1 hypothetical protein SAMN05428941_2408 [Streptomyces sp. 2114.2]